MVELIRYTEKVNDLLKRYGVKFGIYKDHIFHEQLFPFDCLPRIITKEEFEYLSEGLIQRVDALNAFLNDVYGEKNIINDNVIPSEFVYSSSGYLPQCEGIVPPKNIYSHISGIDLVQAKDGTWFVLEDNLRVPSGASYPMIARSICRRASPMTYVHNEVAENRNYAQMLKAVMDYVNTGGINAIFTPGRMNAAYFEHAYLAEKTGAVLVNADDVVVQEDYLYFKNYTGSLEKIGALYRRISDDYLDPMTFREDSLIGIPHLMEIYKKGNVALINAPGNGVADDKGIYYFVPKMIEYYLGEKPILHNAPTYLPYYKEDLQFILDNFDRLVIKDVAEAGGYGVFFANTLTPQLKDKFIAKLLAKPRRFIAQEVIDFKGLEILDGDQLIERKADLRAFVLSGETTKVWKSGLTRFSRNPDSFIVNSSQGGGFKDTWILSR
ncbi:circularly permuted type 2 ATP-grasp protein [Megamonas hypermegale]|uniref:circularly permuted type 2 ATP-grasp protein n=1 Tax=Megamonas hypermegale TaxID=158847 RepID=UPI0025A489AB|nr:circularly permuted type 2 ATP-grasp protein [Megamonas hypermegale]MDM8143027.1 circularly permuted type 2 ATP-grasp protein [Megamonas hypermegale]